MDKGRLEAFSDGVFAVAITLLVLDLTVAGPGRQSLAHQLADRWPSFAAFVVSFTVIGIIWVNHHVVFTRIVTVDRVLLFLNLLLLFFVTLIPFAARVLAAYLRAGGWDARLAAVLYGVVMWGMSIAFAVLFARAGSHPELLHQAVSPAAHRAALRQFGLGVVAYLVLVGVALLSAPVALAGHFALAVFYLFDRTAAPEPA